METVIIIIVIIIIIIIITMFATSHASVTQLNECRVLSSAKKLFKRINSVNHTCVILEVLEISG